MTDPICPHCKLPVKPGQPTYAGRAHWECQEANPSQFEIDRRKAVADLKALPARFDKIAADIAALKDKLK
jgi:hypothetical protein